jgi:hypothetical protein
LIEALKAMPRDATVRVAVPNTEWKEDYMLVDLTPKIGLS